MGRHLNCGGDFGAGRRCFGELSKKQDSELFESGIFKDAELCENNVFMVAEL